MKILVLSQYFWPESFIINDIVRTLDEQGHEVVVATGKPNYPDGNIFEGYRAKGTQRERYLDRIDVVRVPLWPRGAGGAKNLVLNYLSFVLAGLFCLPWLLRKRQFDAILVFAPSPILQAIPAIALKWIKGARLSLWVQDLWPESLAATGFVRNRHALRAVGWLVRGIYRCCDTLLVQSRAFEEPVARYAERSKIIYFPNSMDSRGTTQAPALPETLVDVLDNHFCVVFAGNLGTAQALDTLVEAARQLRDEAGLRLVLVGSGSRLAWLQAQKQALQLDNLVLPGRFPMEAMPAIFERSDVLLVSLSDQQIFAQTVPSKIQAYLAAGRPIAASLNGEGARVVMEAGAGLSSPAEQVDALVSNLRRFKGMDAAQRERMGQAGRYYFDQHFEMQAQVQKLTQII
ncbi:glycosyltransferase family 4 protein [Pseudomonas sp. NPDC089406]|uniref:glycosyltransferase family 4 protein n=1 Tax=Pseudomonas sp. NPDC089406 TaxID=3364463 RepID=UPI00384C98F9